MMTNLALSAKV